MSVYNINAEKDTRCTQSVLQIKGDRHTQILRFHVDRFEGGVDLSEYTWMVQTRNAAGVEDAFTPEAVEVFENVILVDWMIKGTVTAEDGLTEYELSAIEYIDDETTPVWRGGIGTISVRNSLSPSFGDVDGLTEVEQLILYVNGKLQDVIGAGEAASSAAARANAAADRAEPAAESANTAAGAANNAATAANAAAASANRAAAIAGDAADTAIGAISQMQDYTSEYALRVRGETAVSEGNPVQISPDAGSLLKPVTVFGPVQGGSGDPSPSNICPLIGYDALGLTRGSKNLLPVSTRGNSTTNGITWTNNNDGSWTANGTATANSYAHGTTSLIVVSGLKAGKYTISITREKESGNVWARVGNYSQGGSYVTATSAGVASAIFTADGTSEYGIALGVSSGAIANNEKVYIQLEYGSTATPYEPFKSDLYTVQIGQTIYGGRMKWLTGEMTVMKAMLSLTGNAIHDYFSDWHAATVKLSDGRYGEVKCSHYVDSNGSTNLDNSIYFRSAYYGDRICGIKDARFSSKADYAAYLDAQHAAGTPVQIVYTLAEPFTIQLTPHQILALKGVNTLYGEGDTIEVEWVKPLETSIEERTKPLIERIAALEAVILNL